MTRYKSLKEIFARMGIYYESRLKLWQNLNYVIYLYNRFSKRFTEYRNKTGALTLVNVYIASFAKVACKTESSVLRTTFPWPEFKYTQSVISLILTYSGIFNLSLVMDLYPLVGFSFIFTLRLHLFSPVATPTDLDMESVWNFFVISEKCTYSRVKNRFFVATS